MEFFVIWMLFAIVTAIVASSRGRSGAGWLVLGFFGGFFALILVALLPSLNPAQPVMVAGGEVATPETHVRCPDCRELVRMDARKCKHCGTSLTPVVVERPPSNTSVTGKPLP